jgi:hypothetical protein
MKKDIENVVSIYVKDLFQQFTSDDLTFHNISQVQDVVNAVTRIGKQCAAYYMVLTPETLSRMKKN